MNALLRFSAIAFCALLALPALAAQRTFVASTGLDTNACSITSPCRSFTRALTLTDANGEVIVLDSAGYGAFSITQPVSVIAPEGVYAGISVFAGAPNSSHGIVVNGAGIKVTLRGLTINGQGGDDGIRIVNAGDIFIERVTVASTGNDGADAGIRVASGARVFISDSAVRGTAGRGIMIQANAAVHVDRSRIEGNGDIGIFGLSPGGRLRVSDSLVSESQAHGITVNSTALGTWEITVARSTVEGNAMNGVFVGAGTSGTYRVAVTDSVVHRNSAIGVLLFAGTGETATALVGDNRILGNAFAGIRCDGSGTGALVAERNEVVNNGSAFDQAGSCTFESLCNNAARRNSSTDAGTISIPVPALR